MLGLMLDPEDKKISKIILSFKEPQIHKNIRHDDKDLDLMLRDIGDGG